MSSRVRAAAAIGAAGIGLTAFSAGLDPARAAFAWLTSIVALVGLAVGAVSLIAAFHLTGAMWPAVFRRTVESVGLAVIPLAVLAIPLAFSTPVFFLWLDAPELSRHGADALAHQRVWLDEPFFVARAALYFSAWIAIAWLFHSWSTRQDADGDLRWTARMRTLAGIAAPLLVLTSSFAAFDWVMCLNPLWQSTIFGLYVLAGGFVSAIALVALVLSLGFPDGLVTAEHRHAIGKLLFAFTCFWAYLAFSQAMLIWIANLPEEVPWYIARSTGSWKWIGLVLGAAHFSVPFVVLLGREPKRDRWTLGATAALVLAAHYLDVYWLVMPAPFPGGPEPHWSDVTALAGTAGLAGAFVLARASRVRSVPVRDPYLAQSLEYRS